MFETILPLQALYASADHLKTLLFAVTDGMLPSNAGGGYNLRMILRRVFGFGSQFGYSLDYAKIIKGHAKYLEYMFPNLLEGVETTLDVIDEEKKRYDATKEKARLTVVNLVKKAKGEQKAVCNKDRVAAGSIKTQDLITLYKSHGIPPEYISEIAKENGVAVEVPGNFYVQVKEAEGEVGEYSHAPSTKLLAADVVNYPKTKELFYTTKALFKAKVLGIIKDRYVVLDTSAFYPEGGGQVADTGQLIVSGSQSSASGSRSRVSGSGGRTQDTGHGTQDIVSGSQSSVSGSRSRVSGFEFLVSNVLKLA
jgi:alanyl-tRNA synthetase